MRRALDSITRLLRRWFGRDAAEPYPGVRAPLRKGPRAGSAAVALEEPD